MYMFCPPLAPPVCYAALESVAMDMEIRTALKPELDGDRLSTARVDVVSDRYLEDCAFTFIPSTLIHLRLTGFRRRYSVIRMSYETTTISDICWGYSRPSCRPRTSVKASYVPLFRPRKLKPIAGAGVTGRESKPKRVNDPA